MHHCWKKNIIFFQKRNSDWPILNSSVYIYINENYSAEKKETA